MAPTPSIPAIAIVLLLLVGCSHGTAPGPQPSRSDTPSQTATSASPTTSPTTSVQEALDTKLAECKTNLETGLRGQLMYPKTMEIARWASGTYQAAIDISGNTPTPSQVIENDDPATVALDVECQIAARLTPAGDLEVSTPDGDTEGGWSFQSFPASGMVEWAWKVTPRSIGDYSLLLELRPAAAAGSGQYRSVGDNARVSFTTKVQATGNVVDWIVDFWNRYRPVVLPIFVALGGYLAWLIKPLQRWIISFIEKATKKNQADSTPAVPSQPAGSDSISANGSTAADPKPAADQPTGPPG